jgi:hypothetical protein
MRTIETMMKKYKSQQKSQLKSEKKRKTPFTEREKTHGHKISKFMTQLDKNKRRAFFLKSICSDSNECIAFGTQYQPIKQFFNSFQDFQHLTQVKRIGAVSANGFVDMLTFSKQGFNANAVFKSSAKSDGDNLVYEYLVGLFLNRLSLHFPCFIETYGLFLYSSDPMPNSSLNETAWDYIKNKRDMLAVFQSGNITHIPISSTPSMFAQSCQNSKSFAVLNQYLTNSRSLDEIFANEIFANEFMDSEKLVPVLFQVYFPLMCMATIFTHYDLHLGNVMLYMPRAKHYIHYHYHMPDGSVVSFKSEYLVKLIDYGRSFFHDTTESNSVTVHKRLCALRECDPTCGYNSGYQYLQPLNKKHPEDDYYISSMMANESHDLRLLKMIRDKQTSNSSVSTNSSSFSQSSYIHSGGKGYNGGNNKKRGYSGGGGVQLPPRLTALLAKVVYLDQYGTPNHPASGAATDQIFNVTDACMQLKNELMMDMTDNDAQYASFTKLGDLTVYSDGKFIAFEPVL